MVMKKPKSKLLLLLVGILDLLNVIVIVDLPNVMFRINKRPSNLR